MKGIHDVGSFTPGDHKAEALTAYRQQGRIAERLAVVLPFLLAHENLREENAEVYRCATELNAWLECVAPLPK